MELTPMPSQPKPAAPEGARHGQSKAAPSNTAQPHAAGDATVGATLKCTMGEWTGEPTSYAYDWQADGTSLGAPDQDACVLGSNAEGKSITCVVTASNADGSAPATSNAVGPIKARASSSPDGHTIAEEQRARSAIIESMGVEAYKEEVMEDRPPAERGVKKQAPGVTPPTKRD